MDGYKHYIRVDANNIAIEGYADWETDKRKPDEIQLAGNYIRQFQHQLMNEHNQYQYKVVNGALVERTQQELDEEWNAKPPAPKSQAAEIGDLKTQNAEIIFALVMNDLM